MASGGMIRACASESRVRRLQEVAAWLSVEEFLKIWLLQEARSQGPVLACLPWAR